MLYTATLITTKDVIPAKAGIQENTGFRVKPGMTIWMRFMPSCIITSIIILCVLIVFRDAYAYIDPGTGGVVFSYITYLIAAAVTVLGLLLLPFKRIGLRILKKIQSKNKEKSCS